MGCKLRMHFSEVLDEGWPPAALESPLCSATTICWASQARRRRDLACLESLRSCTARWTSSSCWPPSSRAPTRQGCLVPISLNPRRRPLPRNDPRAMAQIIRHCTPKARDLLTCRERQERPLHASRTFARWWTQRTFTVHWAASSASASRCSRRMRRR